ncbi:MAG TPA: hypothetical protein PKE66_15795, partial [Pyrinomonadaceae bacterium]|nr:hypothetical protein [Pyrinomonadaceae bacterium]
CYDEAAVGRTVALADPRPLTTPGLFDAIARSLTGKASIWIPPKSLSEWSLYLPITPTLTGLPHAGVPYFFVTQEYDTSAADELLAPHGVSCPGFADYVGRLIDFVRRHPRL